MQNPVEVGQRADMAEIHQFIIRRGIEEARRQAVTKHERLVIEAAYQVLSDDAEKMGFTYSGFALTSLPHKPQTELMWKRDGHNLTMLMQSGVDRTPWSALRELRPLHPPLPAERGDPHRLPRGRTWPIDEGLVELHGPLDRRKNL